MKVMETSRRPLLAANWKMHKTAAEAEGFINRFRQNVADVKGMDVVVCAPFTALHRLAAPLGEGFLQLGAQNMHWEKEGPFTGEISAPMLKEAGVRYVLIGHSERRMHFAETVEMTARKLTAASHFGLQPVLCIGENDKQRQDGRTEAVLREQLLGALDGLAGKDKGEAGLVIAYEPVWAIGTGTPARGEDAAIAASYIRSLLRQTLGEAAAEVRILYGGSVGPENITDFTGRPDIDGALVGGSSIKDEVFAELVKAVSSSRGRG